MFHALMAPPAAPLPVRSAGIPAPYILTTAVLHGARRQDREVHAHPEGMLMWPAQGSAVAMVDGALRTLAVGQGLWVPALTPHTMELDAASIGCCTYFVANAAPAWPAVGTVQLGAAFREMLLHLSATEMDEDQRLRAQRVVIELLPEETSYVETIPVPTDARLAPLVRMILANPADDRSIEEWAGFLALSVRTIARIFSAELGMTFSQWRRLVRMAAAARLLSAGRPVAVVAHRVGYATTSAFSASFRKVMGTQPSEWHP